LLMDHPDAVPNRGPRRPETHAVPTEHDATRIGLMHSVEDIHQRGLPGSIFSQKGMDGTGPHGEVQVVIRQDGSAPLRDSLHPKHVHRVQGGRKGAAGFPREATFTYGCLIFPAMRACLTSMTLSFTVCGTTGL